MEKEGRKKSSDPKQEALRTHKDLWNKAAKEFIARMIAYKRALNGRGDNAFGLPVSNIKDPLPNEVISFLNTLSSNFEQLATEAAKIEQEQAAYSQSRKKHQEKPVGQPIPEQPTKTAASKFLTIPTPFKWF